MHFAKGLVLLSIIASATELVSSHGSPTNEETKHYEQQLGQLCKRISRFKKISQMQELIKTLSVVLDLHPKLPVVNPSEPWSIMRLSQSPMAPCLQHAKDIMDLDTIIGEKENVCSSQHLDKIERYYERYIKPSSIRCESTGTHLLMLATTCVTSKPITFKFFRLYANQVSFNCKSNLFKSLRIIDKSDLVREEDYEKALPWLTESNMKLCDKIEMQHGEQQKPSPENPGIINEEKTLQCKAARALAEISTLQDLLEPAEADKQLSEGSFEQLSQNNIVIGRGQKGSSEEDHTAGKSGLFIIVPDDQKDAVKDMQEGCSKLRPIYEQTVEPIVRLVRMGFNPTFTNFDVVCSQQKLIKKWFGVTLVCNWILSSHLTDIDEYKELKEAFEAKKKSLVVIDNESPEDGATPGTSSCDVLSLVKNPIDDELWVYKYSTTKMQRFKDSVLKKILKLLKADNIDDQVVLRRNIAGVSSWFLRGLILTVSLIALKS